jgi:hypothetical protein
MKEAPEGFKMFNKEFEHQFVLCRDENETISILTKGGKRITVSVMERAGCVDIKYHDAPLPKVNNGNSDLEQFKIMGFHMGQTPVPSVDLTLMTILLNQ